MNKPPANARPNDPQALLELLPDQHDQSNSQTQKPALKPLKKAQAELPGWQRKLSRFLHQPLIESSTDVISRSIGRPLPLICAATVALLVTVINLVICSYYGYSYNYLPALAGLGIGYIGGFMYEAVRRFDRKSQ